MIDLAKTRPLGAARDMQQHDPGGPACSSVVGTVVEPPISAAKSQFDWIDASGTLEPSLDGNWLIKHMLPAHGIGVLYGRPGSGKTFVSLDLALHVGANLPWRGHVTRGGLVAYVAMEGGGSTVNRLVAWKAHHDARPNLLLTHQTVDLRSSQEDVDALIDELRACKARSASRAVRLIVIDTLNIALAGGNENASEDMGALIANLKRIADALGCFVLVVHHSGKDETRGSRGHSSLLGAVDTEIEIKRDHGKPGTIRVTKQRDGEDGLEFGFDLKPVLMGTDVEGDEVRSYVAIETDAPATPSLSKLTAKQKQALDVLRDLVVDAGQPAPCNANFPKGSTVVRIEAYRERLFLAGVLDRQAKNPRQPFFRLKDALKSRGLLAEWGDLLWVPRSPKHDGAV